MNQTVEAIGRIRDLGASTPFLFLDVDAIGQQAAAMQAAFTQTFRSSEVAYSYKTNSARCVTTALLHQGLGAEVVSGHELELALGDGFRPESILFDGPMKTFDELLRAVELGVRIQLDSDAEIDRILRIAQLTSKVPVLSLRGAVRKRRRWSRFGFEPKELLHWASHLAANGLAVSGFHFNLGAHQMDPRRYASTLVSWGSELQQLVAACDTQQFVIDIGGGFPAHSAARNAKIRSWADYASSVQAALSRVGIADRVHVVAEPGRSLVEDYGWVVYGVTAQKSRGRRKLLIVNGSGLLSASRNTWFHRVQAVPGGIQSYDIYGCACYEHDIIARSVLGPSVIADDQLVIVGSAGGYDIPSARGWNRPLPSVWVQRNNELEQYSPANVFNERRINDVKMKGAVSSYSGS